LKLDITEKESKALIQKAVTGQLTAVLNDKLRDTVFDLADEWIRIHRPQLMELIGEEMRKKAPKMIQDNLKSAYLTMEW
jgi:hypothetical protein